MHILTKRSGLAMALAIVIVVAAGIFVAGCGSSSSSSASSTPTPSASGSTAAWTTADLAAIQSDSALKAALPSNIQSAGTLKCASDIPYPPWEYYDPATSTNPAGFDYDLSQALGKKIGIPVSFNKVPFGVIILSIKGGKNDMIMSDMYDSADRQKSGVSFVDYASDGTSILVPKGNPKGISNIDSLVGQTVACESGTTQQQFLQGLNKTFASAGKTQMQILALPDQPAALLAVKAGRAVGDLTDHSTAEYIAKTQGNGAFFEVVNDPSAPNGYVPQLVGIGLVASNTALIDTMQKALQGLIDDGSYAKIIAKWGVLPVQSAKVNDGPAFAAAQASASPAP